ncbi:casein kinase II beta chain [Phlyctochytrium arcticum]|nr:casein kinase II beta chain [Phlyctochytrium arcticum]
MNFEEQLSATSDDDQADEDGEEYDSTSETGSSVISWISWFCSLPGHEFFVEVPDEFVEDDFNLTGLSNNVPYYNDALDLILDLEPDDSEQAPQSVIESSAELLYGLIHARFILTKQGLAAIEEKFTTGIFGRCPRHYCGGCAVIPCGRSDVPGVDTVKMYCPRCSDLYHPKEPKFQTIDGAFFGTTVAHLLFLNAPDLVPPLISRPTHPPRRATRAPSSTAAAPATSIPSNRPPSSIPTTQSPASSSSAPIPPSNAANDPPTPPEGQPVTSPPDEDAAEEGEGYANGTEDRQPLANYNIYTPKIFGFRVSERSRVGPRMRWLRYKEGMDTTGPEWGTPRKSIPNGSSTGTTTGTGRGAPKMQAT